LTNQRREICSGSFKKILKEGNAKRRLLKKFAAGVYPHTPLYTLSTCTVYSIQYTYSLREGGGGVEPERRGGEQQFTNLGRLYQHD
jgi:hypothetical protein